LEPKEHEILVDSEVIDFVPMNVENVQKLLEPQFLFGVGIKFAHHGRDLQSAFFLVHRFI